MNFRIKGQDSYRSRIKLNHYTVGQRLGKGGFSSVFKAVETYTNQAVAAKVITINNRLSDQMQRIRQEAEILRTLDHPNIVRIYETMETESHYVMFLEYAKGKELFDYIVEYGCLQEDKAARIFHQIVLAVDYLHKKGIVHRDIKAENIMIDENLNIKLIDFGLAKILENSNIFLTTFYGSESYLSPELVSEIKYDGKKVDIWCLGVVLYIMLEATLPFNQKDYENDIQKLYENIKMMKYDDPLLASQEVKQLYRLIFVPSSQRIGIDEVLNSAFFKKYNLSKTKRVKLEPIEKNKKIKVIRQISQKMKISQQEIEYKLKYEKLGSINAVYHLLIDKNPIEKVQHERKKVRKSMVLKRNKSITSQPRHQSIKFKVRKQTPPPNYRITIKISPKKMIHHEVDMLKADKSQKGSIYFSQRKLSDNNPKAMQQLLKSKQMIINAKKTVQAKVPSRYQITFNPGTIKYKVKQ